MQVMERVSEHVCKARMVDKIKYRMVPLLSASEVLETDPLEKKTKPFKRVDTNHMISIITRALCDDALGIEHEKRGKKTGLIRQSFMEWLKMMGGERIFDMLAYVPSALCFCK